MDVNTCKHKKYIASLYPVDLKAFNRDVNLILTKDLCQD